jgi:hypothetical protein
MHEQPEPTEEEQEQGRERRIEEDAMRGAGHEDPESVGDEAGDEEDDES